MISACIIICEQTKNIKRSVESVKRYADEIIAVDIRTTVQGWFCDEKNLFTEYYNKPKMTWDQIFKFVISTIRNKYLLVLVAGEYVAPEDTERLFDCVQYMDYHSQSAMKMSVFSYYSTGGWSEKQIERLFLNPNWNESRNTIKIECTRNFELLNDKLCPKIRVHNWRKYDNDEIFDCECCIALVNEVEESSDLGRAWCSFLRGDINETLNRITMFLRRFNNSKKAYGLLAKVYMYTKEYDLAEEVLRKIFQLEYREKKQKSYEASMAYVEALCDFAELERTRGNMELALAFYRKALNNFRGAYIYANIANLYEQIGRYREALLNYGEAISINKELLACKHLRNSSFERVSNTVMGFSGVSDEMHKCEKELINDNM